jgi:hypothetical protein
VVVGVTSNCTGPSSASQARLIEAKPDSHQKQHQAASPTPFSSSQPPCHQPSHAYPSAQPFPLPESPEPDTSLPQRSSRRYLQHFDPILRSLMRGLVGRVSGLVILLQVRIPTVELRSECHVGIGLGKRTWDAFSRPGTRSSGYRCNACWA